MTKDPCARCGHYVTRIATYRTPMGKVIERVCDKHDDDLTALGATIVPAHDRPVVGPSTRTH